MEHAIKPQNFRPLRGATLSQKSRKFTLKIRQKYTKIYLKYTKNKKNRFADSKSLPPTYAHDVSPTPPWGPLRWGGRKGGVGVGDADGGPGPGRRGSRKMETGRRGDGDRDREREGEGEREVRVTGIGFHW